jgi:hypothetical protein
VRHASFAKDGHGGVVLTEGMEWRWRLDEKSVVDGRLQRRGWTNGTA